MLTVNILHKNSLRSEVNFDAEFVDGLNDTAQVVAEDFTEGFVSAARGCLAPQAFPELGLYHAESRFDV